MKWRRKISVSYPLAFLLVLLALSVIAALLYANSEVGGLTGPVFGGVLTGLIVAIIQFAWDWIDGSNADRLQKLQVHQMLSSRDNANLYREKIISSKGSIDVLGVTASRFLEDFASGTSSNDESKVLLVALQRGVKVRILAATDPAEVAITGANGSGKGSQDRLAAIAQQFPNGFQFGFYETTPAHSIVAIDDRAIIGPVFPGKKSKDLPAVEVSSQSPLAKSYKDYFEYLWSARVNRT